MPVTSVFECNSFNLIMVKKKKSLNPGALTIHWLPFFLLIYKGMRRNLHHIQKNERQKWQQPLPLKLCRATWRGTSNKVTNSEKDSFKTFLNLWVHQALHHRTSGLTTVFHPAQLRAGKCQIVQTHKSVLQLPKSLEILGKYWKEKRTGIVS